MHINKKKPLSLIYKIQLIITYCLTICVLFKECYYLRININYIRKEFILKNKINHD
uniref:Uncharacterized protein n=1 Tax=Physcomitrium patens TaxID=3218 RepID=A0A2K1K1I2_PHYPA|nr:hypothetical protein PHYPA_012105 [Physcomitrium patens]